MEKEEAKKKDRVLAVRRVGVEKIFLTLENAGTLDFWDKKVSWKIFPNEIETTAILTKSEDSSGDSVVISGSKAQIDNLFQTLGMGTPASPIHTIHIKSA